MTSFPAAVQPYMGALVLHIATGCFAIAAGYTAMLAAKGGTLHRRAGTVFVAAMLSTTSVAVYLAASLQGRIAGATPNIAGGALAFYLVLSAYMTVRHRPGTVGLFERTSFLIPLGIAALFFFWGFAAANSPKHAFDGYRPTIFFVIGALCLFFAALDLRVLAKGGLTGVARIARHLWRMGFAFFFAAASIFLGRRQVIPAQIQGSKLFLVLGLAPLGFLLFWMVRVRFKPWRTS